MSEHPVPPPIRDILCAETPAAWLTRAAVELDLLLLDHANCELKAASTALSMIYRYREREELIYRMSRLVREELRHFEQVERHIDNLGIVRRHVSPSRYAAGLLRETNDSEPERLRQRLIVAALIEARSCERFAVVAELVPDDIAVFYRGLLESESRHFQHYLALAESVSGPDRAAYVTDLERLCAAEADLVLSPDPEFRFHSGLPV